ncbi:unnamed protein product [Caenorhabditis auriculariae]|uniref:non-specific serine/threonine protein kinase n=1 Tax=Caenorhabditis auriculariae TaxID=2777116 RepID=A0A8S1HAP9_9PELO|nr:unnamed protein product [Caenorhabditis auriculariae]
MSRPEPSPGTRKDSTAALTRLTSKTKIQKARAFSKNVPSSQQKRNKPEIVRKLLKAGELVLSLNQSYSWEVLCHLGSGGFGDVYKVKRTNNDKEFAMKTEFNVGSRTVRRLKVEKNLLQELMTRESRRHFVEFVEYGTNVEYKWFVMTLIGPSLDSVRRIFTRNYTCSTVYKTSIQLVEALQDLHNVGYLHRDIKPANVCIGLPPNDIVIFLLDFGIARKYLNKKGIQRPARSRVRFFGTARFCSRACHNNIDQSPKDDLEGWLYTVMDLFCVLTGLPWKMSKHPEILAKKNELFADQNLPAAVPSHFKRIMRYMNALKYTDCVDYHYVINELKTEATEQKISLTDKFDWEGKSEELKRKKTPPDENKEKSVGDEPQSGQCSETEEEVKVVDKKKDKKKDEQSGELVENVKLQKKKSPTRKTGEKGKESRSSDRPKEAPKRRWSKLTTKKSVEPMASSASPSTPTKK